MWARPQAYWLFDRDTTLEGAKEQLRSFARNGLGGVTIEPGGVYDGVDIAGPHVPSVGWPYPYLSEEWFGFLDGILGEADKLGMTAYLLDVPLTMSGSAKGQVAEPWRGGDPSLGWTSLREVVPGVTYQQVTVPWWVDPLNPVAVDRAIELNYGAHAKHVGRHFGQALQAMWSDEVSLRPTASVGTFGFGPRTKEIPWTSAFPEYFKARAGYDLTPDKLRHVFTPDVADPESRRVSYDYWDAVSARFAETYYGRISQWAAGRGLGFIGQLLGEERVDSHFFVEGTYFRPAAQPTIASTDLIDHASTDLAGMPFCNNDGCFGSTQKFVSSAAHLFDRDRVHLEAYDLANPELKQRPRMLRALIDHSITRGVNLIAYHSYDYGGGGFGHDDVLYDKQRLWTDYTARLQYLFAGGTPVPDVAIGYAPEAWWVGDSVDPDAYALVSAAIGSANYQYDHLPLELLTEADVNGGLIRYGKQSYRTLVVPDWSTASLGVMRQIAGFVNGGGTIVAVGRAPRFEVHGKDPELANLVQSVFGFDASDAPASLLSHRYGNGTALWAPGDFTDNIQDLPPERARALDPMIEALRKASQPRVRVQGSPVLPTGLNAVETLAYRRAGADTYLVHNFPRWTDKEPGHAGFDYDFPGQPARIVLDVPATGVPHRWDAERGTVSQIAHYDVRGSRMRIPLELDAFASTVIRLHPGDPLQAPHVTRTSLRDVGVRNGRVEGYRPTKTQRLDPTYTVSFSDGTTQTRRAGPWTEPDEESGADGRMWFVGSGTYRTKIDLPSAPRGGRVMLDLGGAGDVADVRLNGTPVGTRAWPGYRFDVTKALRSGPETLEITVTTSQAASFPNDPRYPAGLLGPVTVTSERLVAP